MHCKLNLTISHFYKETCLQYSCILLLHCSCSASMHAGRIIDMTLLFTRLKSVILQKKSSNNYYRADTDWIVWYLHPCTVSLLKGLWLCTWKTGHFRTVSFFVWQKIDLTAPSVEVLNAEVDFTKRTKWPKIYRCKHPNKMHKSKRFTCIETTIVLKSFYLLQF